MTTLDWGVLAFTLAAIVAYGMYRGRKNRDIGAFLLADRSMPWYTVALSIMATQASAITFTSTPGLGYSDGLRFVQYYFGLPVAMVILSVTAVPAFRNARVYTAYEFLEKRFDLRMRILTSLIFLVGRGLGVGFTIYAPSLVLSILLGWDIGVTSALIGGVIILYAASGGVKAIQWTHFQQMIVILSGMAVAFVIAVSLLPPDVSFGDSLRVAGAMGRLKVLDFSFNPNDRYTFWSGIIGGTFIAMAYFGTDQSQVQRYLTGESVAQSRLALLFNAVIKVPMQFLILLLGVAVFSFYQFVQPPLYFNPTETERIRSGGLAAEYDRLESWHTTTFEAKKTAISGYLDAGTGQGRARWKQHLAEAGARSDQVRADMKDLAKRADPSSDGNDTNFIFLTFVITYLPAGFIGLLFACIFAATMSSTSGELSALATCSVVDVYKRLVRPDADDRHYLVVSRLGMVFWGIYAIAFARFAGGLGALIEAVNIVGSLFYGTMLGIFLIAFYIRRVGGWAAFWAALVGEAAVLVCAVFTDISWLWYNVVGCGVVVLAGLALQRISDPE
jgi:solute:Na+ symporter, SSS family